MTEITHVAVEVQVMDYRKKALPYAAVRLSPLDDQPRSDIRLKFDKSRAVFRNDDVQTGSYRIHVSARSYRPDQREVEVTSEGLRVLFVLGKPRMPFYYRGKVKVPFERRDDLVAFHTSRLSVRQERSLLKATSDLELEALELDRDKFDTDLRVCRLPRGLTLDGRRKTLGTLRRRRDVNHAGQIVELSDEGVSFLTTELVVQFKPEISAAEVKRIAAQHGLQIQRQIPYSKNGYELEAPDASGYEVLDLCDELVKTGSVEYAEPNLVTSAVDDQVVPTDFLYAQQWHLPMIQMEETWQVLRDRNAQATSAGDPEDLTFGSHEVILAVMDRGIESQTAGGVVTPRHDDFNGNVSDGQPKVYELFDFATMVANNDNPPNDHGMGCSGVATALVGNPSVVAGETEGVVGAAPNCLVMGLIRPAVGTDTQYADAYYWAAGFDPNSTQAGFPDPISPGADIITNSFGASSGSPISGIMSDCIDDLTTNGRGGRGVVLFFSAGNGNTTLTLQRPWAAYDKTIAVAASTDADVRAGYSNFGPEIDICAPSSNGTGITTSDLIGGGNLAGHTGGGNDYRDNFGGTSSATPLAAGLAALMFSANPYLAWTDIRDILRRTAIKIDFNNNDPVGQWVDNDGDGGNEFSQWYGYGRIDSQAAVREASLLYAARLLEILGVRRVS